MKRSHYAVLIIIGLMFLGAGRSAFAAEPEPGVARVSLIHGDVNSMRGDSGDLVALTVNAPVVRGDQISTGDRSRTELQLDYANVLRLGEKSEARIAELSASRIQVQLSSGVLNLTVLNGNEADVEIDTPNVAVRPLKEGRYRLQVNSQGETEVIVRKGEAEVFTSQGSVIAKKNDLVTVRGANDPEYQVAKAPGRDSWDDWNEDRDDVINHASSWSYGSRYYTGMHDLDRYGRWMSVPGYDRVWSPYADAYWAPYRSGRWVWESYWGWTWVSYEPWGWAPYHYGRWFCQGSSWYWWPGPAYAHYRPLWAPAYVSFFGFGFGRLQFSFGGGWGYDSLGWLPIGPSDYYYPWHGRHNGRYRAVNITNINIINIRNDRNAFPPLGGRGRPHGSNLQNALDNPRLRDSITRVRTDDFVNGRGRNDARRVDQRELRDAQFLAGTPPVVPTRDSLRSSDRETTPRGVERTVRTDRMFSRRQPPTVNRTFDEGARSMREMVQRTDPTSGFDRGRTDRSSNPGNRSLDQSRGAAGSRDLADRPSRSGDPTEVRRNSNSATQEPGGREGAGTGGNWQRFNRGQNGPDGDRVRDNRSQESSPAAERNSRPDRGAAGESTPRTFRNEDTNRGGSSPNRARPAEPARPERESRPSAEPAKPQNPSRNRPETRSSLGAGSNGFMSAPAREAQPSFSTGAAGRDQERGSRSGARFQQAPRFERRSEGFTGAGSTRSTPEYGQAPRSETFSGSSRGGSQGTREYREPRSEQRRYAAPRVDRAPSYSRPSGPDRPSYQAPGNSRPSSESRAPRMESPRMERAPRGGESRSSGAGGGRSRDRR